ncbi:MAG: cytochrome c-type biogenesis protein CcmH [Chloroflexi bacterium]|nr:cytochrome c-type biogenesis protein CcmH [Chloroflexota bacterium]
MKIKVLVIFALAAGFGAALFFVSRAAAQTPTISDNQVNEVARQMYCPVCENIPLDVCPTTACAQWRELIRQKLAAGWTDQQIKDYFVQQYGERVLAEPPQHGINWAIYILPPVAILGGVLIVVGVLRSMKRKAPSAMPLASEPAAPSGPESEDIYVKQMEEELKKHRD